MDFTQNNCGAKNADKPMFRRLLIAGLFTISSNAGAHEPGDHTNLLDFLAGKYVLVGKRLESDETFVGSIVLQHVGDGLKGNRIVATSNSEVTGVIEHPQCCESTHILRIYFKSGGTELESSYLIASDLDNYGRLSGYVYDPAQKTDRPGMEVLFIDHRNKSEQ